MKEKNGNKTCHNFHINVGNTAYLTSNLAFRFERLNYIQMYNVSMYKRLYVNICQISRLCTFESQKFKNSRT